MGMIDWFAKRKGYEKPADVAARVAREFQQQLKRMYQAAKVDRLSASWGINTTTSDKEIRDSLPQLRARSRQLMRDTPQGRRFVSLCAVNVIGPEGIGLQNRAVLPTDPSTFDDAANRIIEEKFQEWGESRLCSFDRQLTLLDQESMFIKTLVSDGETLTRKIREPGAANRFGSSLQWFEADHLPVEHNKVLGGGQQIVMAIEKDAFGRNVRFHILEGHPGNYGDAYTAVNRVIPIPADQMIHVFVKERPSQSRGVPWMHAVMTNINMRAGYQEAALVAARVGASKMGFLKTPTGDEYVGEAKDENGNSISDAEPGHIEELVKGWEFQPWDPTYPTGEYDTFVKAQDRDTAAGLNVSYHALTGDLADVNYSSIRAGTLEMRDMWRFLQRFTAVHFCTPVYQEWLYMALLMGQIPGYDLTDYERLNKPTWEVRGWEWVDPLKEIKASIEAVEFGLSTRTLELSKRGLDLEDVYKQLANEKSLAEKYGIELKTSPQPQGGAINAVTD